MTFEEADIVLEYKNRLEEYNRNRVFSLTPSDVARLDLIAKSVLNTNTNWYCAGCCIERITQLMAEANKLYEQD
jgi:hypothetical protein